MDDKMTKLDWFGLFVALILTLGFISGMASLIIDNFNRAKEYNLHYATEKDTLWVKTPPTSIGDNCYIFNEFNRGAVMYCGKIYLLPKNQ